jgi:hypothetical protein
MFFLESLVYAEVEDCGFNKTEDLLLEARRCRASNNKLPGFI